MMEWTARSPAETRQLGEKLAKWLLPGDVLLLLGDMGAGKSEFTRGIGRGLGVEGHIASPTFTILQAYDSARIPLYHFDWYRLADAGELYEMGMEEYMGGDGVAVVEWPERAMEAVPETHLQITLTPEGDEVRHITVRPMGGFRELPCFDAEIE